MNKGIMAVATLVIFLAFCPVAAWSQTSGEAGRDTFRLTHIESFEPFAVVGNGTSKGLTVDILTEALSRVGLKVVFAGQPQEKEQEVVLKGEADGLSFFAINAERKKSFDFSDPYLMTGGALFVKSPAPPCNSLKGLEGRTVATPLKGPLAGHIKKNFPGVKVFTDVKDYKSTLQAVLDGKADAAALNTQVGAVLARDSFPGRFSMPEKGFLEIPVGVAVAKGKHGDFLAKLNKGLKAIMVDGTYDRIIAKWGVPATTKPPKE
jgi:ABC-type amino acid transport substrate-binding protein